MSFSAFQNLADLVFKKKLLINKLPTHTHTKTHTFFVKEEIKLNLE